MILLWHTFYSKLESPTCSCQLYVFTVHLIKYTLQSQLSLFDFKYILLRRVVANSMFSLCKVHFTVLSVFSLCKVHFTMQRTLCKVHFTVQIALHYAKHTALYKAHCSKPTESGTHYNIQSPILSSPAMPCMLHRENFHYIVLLKHNI